MEKKKMSIVIAAIIAVIVMFTGLMSVSASRQKIIEFIETVFPKYTQVELSEESAPTPETIETAYTLGYVPDGYKLVQYDRDVNGVFAIWKNLSGDEIVFIQNLLDGNVSIDNEHECTQVMINDYKGYLTKRNTMCQLDWTDGNYWYSISVPISEKDNIIEMAKNISEKN